VNRGNGAALRERKYDFVFRLGSSGANSHKKQRYEKGLDDKGDDRQRSKPPAHRVLETGKADRAANRVQHQRPPGYQKTQQPPPQRVSVNAHGGDECPDEVNYEPHPYVGGNPVVRASSYQVGQADRDDEQDGC
jgi:hypothetical protein